VASRSWRPTGPPPPPARPRQLLPLALCLLVTGAFAVLTANPAAAAPDAAAVEKQIDQAWNKLEPVIEQHNLARQELATKKKRAAELVKKIQPLEQQVNAALSRVGDFAALAYKGGRISAISSVLDSGTPMGAADKIQVLDRFAHQQRMEIQNVVDLRAQYRAQKAPLDELIADLTKNEAQLAAREKQINDEIKKLQDLRLAAYGSGGSTGSLRPVPCPVSYPGGAAGIAIKFACAQIGKPYQYGADGLASYDCSGLVEASWARAGVSLPHNAAAQRRTVKSVSRANLRAGDLVFYYSDVHHVGIYAGGGWIVHASRAGEPIRMKRVDDGPIHSFGRPG
jgi:peptidoglycan DL-endopeptidase CwlO